VRDEPATLLLDLIESGIGDRPAALLRAEFPTALRYLERIGALKPSSTLTVVYCSACDKDHEAVVEFDIATRAARHFCPEAGWVDDTDNDLASLRVDPEWLLDWLESALSVMPPRRRRVLITGQVWHIGEAVLGKTSLTIVLSRGLVGQAERNTLCETLAQVPPTEIGIVLTTAVELPTEPLTVHRYYALNLREILRAKADGLVIDQGRFATWVRAFSRKTGKPVAGQGGRHSAAALLLDIFRGRRTRNLPYRSKAAEAKEIIAEWPTHYPDCEPPGSSTVRKHLPNPEERGSRPFAEGYPSDSQSRRSPAAMGAMPPTRKRSPA
jgi:hypothetical protein